MDHRNNYHLLDRHRPINPKWLQISLLICRDLNHSSSQWWCLRHKLHPTCKKTESTCQLKLQRHKCINRCHLRAQWPQALLATTTNWCTTSTTLFHTLIPKAFNQHIRNVLISWKTKLYRIKLFSIRLCNSTKRIKKLKRKMRRNNSCKDYNSSSKNN